MSTGTEVTPWDPKELGNVGMEDVGVGDLVIPRLRLEHKDGVFVNSLSNEVLPSLDCIILGLVKQRIMWDPDVQEGDKPQCKSADHDHGYPQMREDIPFAKQFPWDQSNFKKEDFPPVNGQIVLPCDSCVFAQWSKNPRTNENVPPPCNEQHTYPLLYTQDDGETWTTAVVTFQRTGIKPSKNYLSLYNQAGMPMFTARTNLTLQVQHRGKVDYSIPVFKKGEETDRAMWRRYADSYYSIRDFLRTPPRAQSDDDEPTAPSENVNTAPVAPTAPAASTAAPVVVTPADVPSPAPGSGAPAPVPANEELPF